MVEEEKVKAQKKKTLVEILTEGGYCASSISDMFCIMQRS